MFGFEGTRNWKAWEEVPGEMAEVNVVPDK